MTAPLPDRLEGYGKALANWLGTLGPLRLIVSMPGNIGDQLIWRGCCDLILSAASGYRNVVVLASDYDTDVPVVAEALARPNVWAFARQPLSYAAIRPFGRAALMPDPALWCRRTDQGSCLRDLPFQVAPAINRDLSTVAANLDAFLEAVGAAGRVVTDRLHIAVAAVMLGKALSWIDPYDRKISAYLPFAFDEAQRSRCTPIRVEEMVERGWLQRRGG